MNKEDYLKRVLEFIVEDTIIDERHMMIKLPYAPKHIINYKNLKDKLFTYYLSGENQFDMFYNYCEGMYGLTGEECIIIWGMFTDRIVKEIEKNL